VKRKALAVVMSVLMVSASAGLRAEIAVRTSTSGAAATAVLRPLEPRVLRRSVERFSRTARSESRQIAGPPTMIVRNRGMNGGRAAVIAVASIAGLFAGAYAGAAIENKYHPCACDDPGLQGALIGMPIGAIAGGVLAAVLTR